MSVQIGTPAVVIRAHQELFAYWSGLRRGGQLPARADLDPAGFKRLLPSICLVDVQSSPRDYKIRLAGTSLYGVFGGEITGKLLSEIYTPAAAEYWRDELDKIVKTAKPGVGYHNLAWRGAAQMTVLWLRLPLARDGRNVNMMLGYDAVVGFSGAEVSGGRAA